MVAGLGIVQTEKELVEDDRAEDPMGTKLPGSIPPAVGLEEGFECNNSAREAGRLACQRGNM